MFSKNQLKTCLICSESYGILIGTEIIINELEELTVGEVLQKLHFFDISDDLILDRTLCLICLSKVYDCYNLTRKCDQVEKSLETVTNGLYSFSANNIKLENTFEPEENRLEEWEIKAEEIDINQGISKGSTVETDEKVDTSFEDKTMTKNHDKFHVCDVCNKSFGYVSLLMRHKLIHSGRRPYVCDVCNKSFNDFSNLTNHQMIHKGEKPHVCDVCSKSFSRAYNLKIHKLIHLDVKGNVCEVCNKSYTRLRELKRHKMTHTGEKPYVCDVCSKSFLSSNELRIHKSAHTDLKPYVCNVCNKTFHNYSNLYAHKSVHSDKKSYVCDVCNLAFKHRSTMSKHRRIHKD